MPSASSTAGSGPAEPTAPLGSSDQLPLLRSDGPLFSTNGKIVFARICPRDDASCVMQRSSCVLLWRCTAVTVTKSAQARSSRKSGRAIGETQGRPYNLCAAKSAIEGPEVRLIFFRPTEEQPIASNHNYGT